MSICAQIDLKLLVSKVGNTQCTAFSHQSVYVYVCACACRCANITANSCADSFICVISVLNTIITIPFNGSFDFHHPNEMNWFSVIHAFFHSSHHRWTSAAQQKGKARLFQVGKKKQTNKVNHTVYTTTLHTYHSDHIALWIVFGLAMADTTTKINDEKL